MRRVELQKRSQIKSAHLLETVQQLTNNRLGEHVLHDEGTISGHRGDHLGPRVMHLGVEQFLQILLGQVLRVPILVPVGLYLELEYRNLEAYPLLLANLPNKVHLLVWVLLIVAVHDVPSHYGPLEQAVFRL